jgi:hypothetical protein
LEFDPEKRPSAQEIIDTLKKTERLEKRCTEPGASSHGRRRNFWIEAFRNRVEVDPKTMDSMLRKCKQGIHKFYDGDMSMSMEELYSSFIHSPSSPLFF